MTGILYIISKIFLNFVDTILVLILFLKLIKFQQKLKIITLFVKKY